MIGCEKWKREENNTLFSLSDSTAPRFCSVEFWKCGWKEGGGEKRFSEWLNN